MSHTNTNNKNQNNSSNATNGKNKRKGMAQLMREAVNNVPILLRGKKPGGKKPAASSTWRRFRTELPKGNLTNYIEGFLEREERRSAGEVRALDNEEAFGDHRIDFGNHEDGDGSTGDMTNMHVVYANPDFGPKYKPAVAKAA